MIFRDHNLGIRFFKKRKHVSYVTLLPSLEVATVTYSVTSNPFHGLKNFSMFMYIKYVEEYFIGSKMHISAIPHLISECVLQLIIVHLAKFFLSGL